MIAYGLARAEHVAPDKARTAATIAYTIASLWILVIQARPLKTWKIALVGVMGGLAAMAFVVPAGRSFYDLYLPPSPTGAAVRRPRRGRRLRPGVDLAPGRIPAPDPAIPPAPVASRGAATGVVGYRRDAHPGGGDRGGGVRPRPGAGPRCRPGHTRVSMSGKTDPQIVREYLAVMEIDEADHHVSLILDHLEAELAAAAGTLASGGWVLPGVPAILSAAGRHAGGSPIGPHGQHRPQRGGETGRLRARRNGSTSRWAPMEATTPIEAHWCRSPSAGLGPAGLLSDSVWVIGDTANDLACARAGGARCLLVATGRASMTDLEQLGADAVVEDLSDVDSIVKLLTAD